MKLRGNGMCRVALLAAAIINGCAAVPAHPALERVGTELHAARQNRAMNRTPDAERTLRDAELQFDQADDVWRTSRDYSETEHLALLAEQKLEIAKLSAVREAVEERTGSGTLPREQEPRARLAPEYYPPADPRLALAIEELQPFHPEATAGQGMHLTIDDEYFEPNASALLVVTTQDLAPLTAYLRDRPRQQVTVEGRSDAGAFSQRGSLARAEAVRNELVAQGVPPGRITARGVENLEPMTTDAVPAGQMHSRRVEVWVSAR